MPRGVYDRSKMKKNTKKPGPKPGAKAAAAVKTAGRRGRRPKSEATVSPISMTKTAAHSTKLDSRELTASEQFAIVRENLVTLSQVRNTGVKPGESSQTVDAELTQQLQLMGTLRKFHFANLSDPAVAETAPGNGLTKGATSVPLPPPPDIPVPQIPRSA